MPQNASCLYCDQEITFRRDSRGRRLPFNLDNSRHYCDQYLKSKKRHQPERENVFIDTEFDDFTVEKVPNGRFNRNVTAKRPQQKTLHAMEELKPIKQEINSNDPESELLHISVHIEQPVVSEASNLEHADHTTVDTSTRNPKWTREEIILATDLYLRHQGILFGPKHPEVIGLSNILRKLPLHPESVKNETFRNPNGVGMKLSNIRSRDPHARSAGNANGSKLDGIYWTELCEDPTALAREVAVIRRRFPQAFDGPSVARTIPLVDNAEPRKLTRVSTHKQLARRVPLPNLDIPSKSTGVKSYERDLLNLRRQPWFFTIQIADPRFKWFARHFKGQVRPTNRYLHEWVSSILAIPRLMQPEEVRTHEALSRLHDYVLFLKEMSLEGELHSLVSCVCTAESVPLTLQELGWDGDQIESLDSSDEVRAILDSIQRERLWTPAVDRALLCLRRESIRDKRLLGPTLKLRGVSESTSFSPLALYMACKVLGKPLPLILQDIDEKYT